ncbi:MAG: hypothetical protein IKP65_01910 [Alphaproteobacteria bacterium]|nr:hypothetical protein [Alphaproteobacteria bacterium]
MNKYMTYEDYKKIMKIISESKFEKKQKEIQEFQDKLEMKYPEYNMQYRYWLYEQIEKGI